MLLPQGPVISLGCLCSVAVLSLLQFVPLPCCGWIQSPAATKANVAEIAKGAWIVYECLFSGTSTDWGGQTSERDSTGWSRFSFKEKEIFVQMGMQLCPVLGGAWGWMSSAALTSSGITTQALSGTVVFCLHPTCQNSNDYTSPGSYGYCYLLGRRFAPILVELGWFFLLLLFFPWLLIVTSASFIGFQVVVLCSFVSVSPVLLLCSSELDLRIRISEHFF